MATVKIVKQDGVTNNAITLGIFGRIILLKKYDIKSKEFVDNTGFNGTESYIPTDSTVSVISETNYSKIYNSIDIIGKPIKIGNLEVAQKDFPNTMNWEDAKKACENLGRGWRLPTKDELNTLYINKDKIGGFANDDYWSSTEYYSNYNAWDQYFDSGLQDNYSKGSRSNVRAVFSKNITEKIKESSNPIIGNTYKIENIEVAEKDFPNTMNWEDAKKACENLGRGWRLPTKDELNTLYINKDKIGGFERYDYWSSTEYGDNYAWLQNFNNGLQYYADKLFYHVRAVRAF